MQDKKKTKQTEIVKKVFRRLGKYRIFFVFSLVLAAVSVALTLYVPKLIGQAVDHIIEEDMVNFAGVYKVMLSIGLCTLFTA